MKAEPEFLYEKFYINSGKLNYLLLTAFATLTIILIISCKPEGLVRLSLIRIASSDTLISIPVDLLKSKIPWIPDNLFR
jgi:hypothetical protein